MNIMNIKTHPSMLTDTPNTQFFHHFRWRMCAHKTSMRTSHFMAMIVRVRETALIPDQCFKCFQTDYTSHECQFFYCIIVCPLSNFTGNDTPLKIHYLQRVYFHRSSGAPRISLDELLPRPHPVGVALPAPPSLALLPLQVRAGHGHYHHCHHHYYYHHYYHHLLTLLELLLLVLLVARLRLWLQIWCVNSC